MTTSERLNFTKATLEKLQPPSTGRTTYHDLKVPGLELRVTVKGVKTFCVFRRMKGGSPARITIGRFPDLSIEKARQAALSYIAELASGIDVTGRRRKAKSIAKFSELFDAYIQRHHKLQERTKQESRANYARHLEATLGKMKLSDITRKHVADIHSKITQEGHAVSANRVYSLISSVFGWAVSVGLWETNPATGIRKNPERSRDRFIQGNELPAFFMALNAEPNETIRDFFFIALVTGARRANVLAMNWQDVDLEKCEWRIPLTKNGAPQTVSLATEAVDRLRRRRRDDETSYVFPGAGKSGHLVEPKKGWHRILVRMAGLQLLQRLAARLTWDATAFDQAVSAFLAETDADAALQTMVEQAKTATLTLPPQLLPDLRIHDLRRTLASWQAITGATLPIIGKTLNHKSPTTTSIYARLNQDPVRAAVQRATDEMMRIGGLLPSNKMKSDAGQPVIEHSLITEYIVFDRESPATSQINSTKPPY